MLGILPSETERREQGNLIQWLGEAGGEEARPYLQTVLNDSVSTGMVITLIRTLGDIGNNESLPLIIPFAQSEEERIRRQTAVTLGEFGEPAVDVLQLLLDDPSLAVRSAAWKSIEGINSEE